MKWTLKYMKKYETDPKQYEKHEFDQFHIFCIFFRVNFILFGVNHIVWGQFHNFLSYFFVKLLFLGSLSYVSSDQFHIFAEEYKIDPKKI